MTFELEAEGVRFRCSSPEWTRKLVERGARLVDPRQAASLRRTEEATAPPPRKGARKRRRGSGSRS